jgi:hypothetical protein
LIPLGDVHAEVGGKGEVMAAEKGMARRFALKVTLFTAAVVGIVSLIQVLVIYPRFAERIVQDSHDGAIRSGRHISGMAIVSRILEERGGGRAARSGMTKLAEELELWKIKVFGPEGRVLYSTNPSDEGDMNTHDYFRDIVALGKVHSKSVWGKEVTLEGERVPATCWKSTFPSWMTGSSAAPVRSTAISRSGSTGSIVSSCRRRVSPSA